MSNNLALAWLRQLAVSAEELKAEIVEQDGEPTQTQLAQYETILASGGGTVDMLPLEQVAGPQAMEAELDKVINVEIDLDEDTVSVEDIQRLTAAAAVAALESLEAKIEADPTNAFNINRYDAIGKVFFNNPSVTDTAAETPEQLISAVESLRIALSEVMSVSAESFGELIGD